MTKVIHDVRVPKSPRTPCCGGCHFERDIRSRKGTGGFPERRNVEQEGRDDRKQREQRGHPAAHRLRWFHRMSPFSESQGTRNVSSASFLVFSAGFFLPDCSERALPDGRCG
jgi:hypothetical protein